MRAAPWKDNPVIRVGLSPTNVVFTFALFAYPTACWHNLSVPPLGPGMD